MTGSVRSGGPFITVSSAGLVRHCLPVFAGGRHIFRRCHRITHPGFVNLHRLAVKIRVRKMAGSAAEVDQREIVFLGVLGSRSERGEQHDLFAYTRWRSSRLDKSVSHPANCTWPPSLVL